MWLLTYSVGALLIGRWSATTWRFASARFWLITTNPENKPTLPWPCKRLGDGKEGVDLVAQGICWGSKRAANT